ncbi:MAG TPA: hypothetical protein VK797_21700 [Tepidisphaeraceae bacterium]|nr:hypothetical protein [Tepidisphaeraceae bacterium]
MAVRSVARREMMSRSNRLRYICETLEPRKYLVVLHGGDVFEFWADNTHLERVVVEGNTTAEFFASHINIMTGQFPDNPLPLTTMDGIIVAGPDDNNPTVDGEFGTVVGAGLPPQALPGGGGGTNQVQFNDDIYAIYVSHADLTSRIAVAGVPDLMTPQPQRVMQPYTGAITLLVGPTGGGNPISVSVNNTGTALLGARAVPPMGATNGFPTNEPIFAPQTLPADRQTTPATLTSLGAGLTVAPGNNLSEFLWGGTVLGTVNIHGSIQLFYAGWLLTGNARGTLFGTSVRTDNFSVDGDIQTLLTNGSVGTNTDSGLMDLGVPNYLTNFNMYVGGRAGMIKSLDSFVGSVDVTNSPTAPNINGVQTIQLDVRGGGGFDPWDAPGIAGNVGIDPAGNAGATFGGDPLVNDTTFAGAQFLGTLDANGNVQVTGTNQAIMGNNKPVDYYAVALLAGQTVTAQLTSPVSGSTLNGVPYNGIALGVFDSEQRLLATDYNSADLTSTSGQPFRFTANLPGIYYFAASNGLNTSFDTAFPFPTTLTVPYTLTLHGVGNLALGGVGATTNLLDEYGAGTDPTVPTVGGIHVVNGDLGAAFAGGLVFSISTRMFYVDVGNLRAVEGASLGNGTGPAGTNPGGGIASASFSYGEGPDGFVPTGTVGMLRATSTANATGQGATGVLLWNINQPISGDLPTLTPAQAANFAIGGDYQMVDAANQFLGNLVAQGNIGTIRANSMASFPSSYFQVNALDDPNRQGRIDLIDVAISMGLNGPGGPAIVTGPDGNCRYIHIGDNGAVFRDTFFGGGTPEATLYQPGETASIVDDSGSVVNLTPQSPLDSLLVTTYPIRGSGGAAIVRVEVTNTTTQTAASGLNVVTSGGGSAEIGDILLDGTGTNVTPGTSGGPGGATATVPASASNFPAPGTPGGAPIAGPGSSGNKFTLPALPTPPTLNPTLPMDVKISGSAALDVYEINGPVQANGSLVAGRAQVTSITNTTGGEIVNIHLNSLGILAASGAVGAAVAHNTAASVLGNYHVHLTEDGSSGAPYTYPLFEVGSLVRVLGDIVSISAGELGDVYAGAIANSNSQSDPIPSVNAIPLAVPAGGGLIDASGGAVGSISVGSVIGSVVTSGSINSISISGGGTSWQGSGALGAPGIFSTSLIGPVTSGSDFRGQLVSTVGQLGLTLGGGSINDATVADFSRFDYAEARALVFAAPASATPITFPQLDLVSISVRGNGGIIGSLVAGEHIGTVGVADSGFGIFDSRFEVLGDGTIVGVSAGGYGIRFTEVRGGASIGALTARGNGSNLPIGNFPLEVRQSESGAAFDAVTGLPLTFINDLDSYLGTSMSTQTIVGSTESGVIENSVVVGSRDLGNLNAWTIRGRTVNTTNTNLLGLSGLTTVNMANSVANLRVAGPIDGLSITTGRTTKYQFGGDVANFDLVVSGPLGALVFNSSLLQSSIIAAEGPSGRIQSVTIHGNFNGTISATRTIGKILILGSMTGTVKATYLGSIKLTGGLGNGSLRISTNVGTFATTGDLGTPGNALVFNGSVQTLEVGNDLNLNVSIAQNISQLVVGGSILSAANVTVGNTIALLKVRGDVQAGATVMAHLIKRRIIQGQLLGTITTG